MLSIPPHFGVVIIPISSGAAQAGWEGAPALYVLRMGPVVSMMRTPIRGMCPNCYRHAVAATDLVGTRRPYSGDYACCGACGEFAVFDFFRRANVMRKPTRMELEDIANNESAKLCRSNWDAGRRAAMQ